MQKVTTRLPQNAIKSLLALMWLLALPVSSIADTWKGSIRTKAQVDNRYNKNGDYTGESWSQLFYDNPDAHFKARVSLVGRVSTDIYRQKLQAYQAYLEKDFSSLPLVLRAGRFEKSDNLGLYLLDGGQATYNLSKPLTVEAYAGRPLRVDHVQSVHGQFVAGAEAMLKLTPEWTLGKHWAHINSFDVRGGFQVMQRDMSVQGNDVLGSSGVDINGDVIEQLQAGTTTTTTASTYRINAAARFAGHFLGQDKPMETFIKGSYAVDKNHLENAFVDSWWDVVKNVRLRSYYEAYRPKQQFVTFRDRFYTAYALGQQEVWRGSAEHRLTDKIRYSLGAQYANRDQGYNGYGFNGGISYAWRPGINFSGSVDYLELSSNENAKSLYMSGTQALNAKTRYSVNFALREEDKLLYGRNFAKGIETEWQYMLENDLVLAFRASYIDNTRLYNEYLGAFQLTYYFDRFQPSKP